MSIGLQKYQVFRHTRSSGVEFCEDFTIAITIEGSGTIASWTFVVEMYDSTNTSVTAPSAAITDAANRVVTLTFSGLTMTDSMYRVILFRTDTGARTETAVLGIDVTNVRR